MPFALSCWKLNNHFLQSILYRLAKSLLAVNLQLTEVSCSRARMIVAHNELHGLGDSDLL